MSLGNPWGLIVVIAVLALGWWRWKSQRHVVTGLRLPGAANWVDLESKWGRRWVVVQPWIRFGVIALLGIAICNPQWHERLTDISQPGVDIMVTMDVSGSMLAEDFSPDNRMTAAKSVATSFIESRPFDRIGMVVFGSYALTYCPLTTDRKVLSEMVGDISVGMAGDDTAIGLGVATAVSRLRSSNAKSKVIVLMTDGVNNSGEVVPLAAARLAAQYGVKIYAIGIGKEGGAPIPIAGPTGTKSYQKNPDGSVVLTEIDEPTLKALAKISGGRYFRATDSDGLKRIYQTIDRLEKTPAVIQSYDQVTPLFPVFLIAAFVILLIDIAIGWAVWRSTP